MKTFDSYFTEKVIISILAKKRATLAKKSHDKHFFKNIAIAAGNPHSRKNFLYAIFPPRSQWIRLNRHERDKRDTNALETNAIQLERSVWRIKKWVLNGRIPKPDWLINLESLIKEIQVDALGSSKYSIGSPKVFVALKDKLKKEYRPICLFALKDLIVIGQTSRYLTDCFDQLFLPNSYAFRAKKVGGLSFNHHKAIRDIIEYKNGLHPVTPFVAECDIKKFYDCVNHKVIADLFEEGRIELSRKHNISLDSRSTRLFYSYLDCFSYNDNIAKEELRILKSQGIGNGKIPWVSSSELLQVGSDVNCDRVGVPQGGALSCLIANIVLNKVDKGVLSVSDEDTFYARFCDDMVLMHPDNNTCEMILSKYQDEMVNVKLLIHKPDKLSAYNREFWEKKSKRPYKWDSLYNAKDNVPWLSFVGYQIRFDGLFRVRKSSLKKELEKQVAETDKLIEAIKISGKPRIYEKAIQFRLRQRLISMAVGRQPNFGGVVSMCWCAGFDMVRTNRNIKSQLKKLDRNRERQMKRLERFVKGFQVRSVNRKIKINQRKYYGHPYSYFSKFK